MTSCLLCNTKITLSEIDSHFLQGSVGDLVETRCAMIGLLGKTRTKEMIDEYYAVRRLRRKITQGEIDNLEKLVTKTSGHACLKCNKRIMKDNMSAHLLEEHLWKCRFCLKVTRGISLNGLAEHVSTCPDLEESERKHYKHYSYYLRRYDAQFEIISNSVSSDANPKHKTRELHQNDSGRQSSLTSSSAVVTGKAKQEHFCTECKENFTSKVKLSQHKLKCQALGGRINKLNKQSADTPSTVASNAVREDIYNNSTDDERDDIEVDACTDIEDDTADGIDVADCYQLFGKKLVVPVQPLSLSSLNCEKTPAEVPSHDREIKSVQKSMVAVSSNRAPEKLSSFRKAQRRASQVTDEKIGGSDSDEKPLSKKRSKTPRRGTADSVGVDTTAVCVETHNAVGRTKKHASRKNTSTKVPSHDRETNSVPKSKAAVASKPAPKRSSLFRKMQRRASQVTDEIGGSDSDEKPLSKKRSKTPQIGMADSVDVDTTAVYVKTPNTVGRTKKHASRKNTSTKVPSHVREANSVQNSKAAVSKRAPKRSGLSRKPQRHASQLTDEIGGSDSDEKPLSMKRSKTPRRGTANTVGDDTAAVCIKTPRAIGRTKKHASKKKISTLEKRRASKSKSKRISKAKQVMKDNSASDAHKDNGVNENKISASNEANKGSKVSESNHGINEDSTSNSGFKAAYASGYSSDDGDVGGGDDYDTADLDEDIEPTDIREYATRTRRGSMGTLVDYSGMADDLEESDMESESDQAPSILDDNDIGDGDNDKDEDYIIQNEPGRAIFASVGADGDINETGIFDDASADYDDYNATGSSAKINSAGTDYGNPCETVGDRFETPYAIIRGLSTKPCCHLCHATFTTYSGRNRHIKSSCFWTRSRRSVLDSQIKRVSKSAKPDGSKNHVCSYCKKAFDEFHKLEVHKMNWCSVLLFKKRPSKLKRSRRRHAATRMCTVRDNTNIDVSVRRNVKLAPKSPVTMSNVARYILDTDIQNITAAVGADGDMDEIGVFDDASADYDDYNVGALTEVDIVATDYEADGMLDIGCVVVRGKYLGFSCNLCHTIFLNRMDCERHIIRNRCSVLKFRKREMNYRTENCKEDLIHFEMDKYPCSYCKKTFEKRSKLEDHKLNWCMALLYKSRRCNSDAPVKCLHCGCTVESKLKMESHYGQCVAAHACPACPRRYVDKKSLHNHMSVIGHVWKCHNCARWFPWVTEERQRHAQANCKGTVEELTYLPPGTCNICRIFQPTSSCFLVKHITENHVDRTAAGTLSCPCCNEKVGNDNDLYWHLERRCEEVSKMLPKSHEASKPETRLVKTPKPAKASGGGKRSSAIAALLTMKAESDGEEVIDDSDKDTDWSENGDRGSNTDDSDSDIQQLKVVFGRSNRNIKRGWTTRADGVTYIVTTLNSKPAPSTPRPPAPELRYVAQILVMDSTCPKCDTHFTSDLALRYHLEQVHVFKCPKCEVWQRGYIVHKDHIAACEGLVVTDDAAPPLEAAEPPSTATDIKQELTGEADTHRNSRPVPYDSTSVVTVTKHYTTVTCKRSSNKQIAGKLSAISQASFQSSAVSKASLTDKSSAAAPNEDPMLRTALFGDLEEIQSVRTAQKDVSTSAAVTTATISPAATATGFLPTGGVAITTDHGFLSEIPCAPYLHTTPGSDALSFPDNTGPASLSSDLIGLAYGTIGDKPNLFGSPPPDSFSQSFSQQIGNTSCSVPHFPAHTPESTFGSGASISTFRPVEEKSYATMETRVKPKEPQVVETPNPGSSGLPLQNAIQIKQEEKPSCIAGALKPIAQRKSDKNVPEKVPVTRNEAKRLLEPTNLLLHDTAMARVTSKICPFCEVQTFSTKEFDVHLGKAYQFECSSCKTLENTLVDFIDHVKTCKNFDLTVTCDVCQAFEQPSSFKSYRTTLVKHIVKNHLEEFEDEQTRCPLCYHVLRKDQPLAHHMQYEYCNIKEVKESLRPVPINDMGWSVKAFENKNGPRKNNSSDSEDDRPKKARKKSGVKGEVPEPEVEQPKYVPRSCHICKKHIFYKPDMYRNHITRSHSVKLPRGRLQCKECLLVIDEDKTLEDHQRSKTCIRSYYACSECPVIYKDWKLYSQHLTMHEPSEDEEEEEETKKDGEAQEKFKCMVCDALFEQSPLRKRHEFFEHFKDGCCFYENCSFSVGKHRKARKLMMNHYFAEHLNVFTGKFNKQYPCRICDDNFVRGKLKNKHEMTHFPNMKCPYEGCTWSSANLQKIDRRFLQRAVRHYQTKHLNLLQYHTNKCMVCLNTFQSKKDLNSHTIESHCNSEPLRCEKCSYSTPILERLRLHVKVNHSGKLYKCDKCEFSCTWHASLARHRATIHDKEKKHLCAICGMKFTQGGSVSRHMKKAHPHG